MSNKKAAGKVEATSPATNAKVKVTKTTTAGVKIEPTIEETKAPETPVPATPVVEAVKKQRGRPVVIGSNNYNKKLKFEEMRAAGKEVKRGRPVVEGSAHATKKARIEEARANGTLKLGRPKMIKPEVPVVDAAVPVVESVEAAK